MAAAALGFAMQALAAIIAGGAIGTYGKKQQDKRAEQDAFSKLVMSGVQSGQDLHPAIIKKAFPGMDPAGISALQFMAKGSKDRQEAQQKAMMSLMGGGDTAAPSPATPSADMDQSGDLAAMGGQPQQAMQAGQQPDVPMAPAWPSEVARVPQAAPGAQPVSTAAPAAPVGAPGALRSKPSVSMTFPGSGAPPSMTMSATGLSPVEAQRATEHQGAVSLLAEAQKKNLSYLDVGRIANERGLALVPGFETAMKEYGQQSFNRALQSIPPPRTPTEAHDNLVLAFGKSGYMPTELKTALMPTPQLVDERYMQAMQSNLAANPGVPFSVVDRVVRNALGNVVPSEGAQKNIQDQARATIEADVRRAAPMLNAAEVEAEVMRRMNYAGATEAQRGRADAPAGFSQEAKDQFLKNKELPPTASELRNRGGQGPSPGQAIEGAKSEAIGQGVAKKTAETKADLVPANELFEKYATLQQEQPEAGLTREQLNQKINAGEIGVMHVDKRSYRNLVTIEGIVSGYARSLATLAPVLDNGVMSRLLARLSAAPTPSEIPGLSWLPPIPALSDAQMKQYGITPEQAKAAAAWVHYNNTALLTLRSLGEGERGNIAKNIIGRGEETFPNMSDNARTATAKLELLRRRIGVENAGAITYKGRDWISNPTSGGLGIVPRGTKLAPGWELVR